jgi:3alpha(or 20beta)-hydroxysteroid dehydrogenase
VLINNAGIIHVNPLLDETLESWNRLLTVNATGTLLGMQAAIPVMRASGGGSIINVASIFGVTGSEGYIAYTASKAAIIAMTKTAALEHAADRIRVNATAAGTRTTPPRKIRSRARARPATRVSGGAIGIPMEGSVRGVTMTRRSGDTRSSASLPSGPLAWR